MARPNQFKNPTTCSFKLETDDLNLLKDFASACGQDVSDLLREFVTGLVKANAEMIEEFRAQKSRAVKATFDVSATPKKSARPSKKKEKTAQATSGDVKVGDGNAENS